ncbi:hypothetical protein HK102_009773 [Quaeritorhiza haematococci]|nr:hypothetical protein HK102_009773 [Quaeritorhiza haematococci]
MSSSWGSNMRLQIDGKVLEESSEIAERCLYLNIYTPFAQDALPSILRGPNSTLPVVLAIHGGSFEKGSASIPLGKGSDLAVDLNAIIVTFNYRLSLFGFLDLSGTEDAPANAPINFGVMDQRVAIEWVLENISAFGGDPTRVTIMGQSAGALSVAFHMTNPAIRNRVKNYVLTSPPATGLRTRAQSRLAASRLATKLGCKSNRNSGNSTYACMLQKSTSDILNAIDERYTTDEQAILSELAFVLVPVIDGVEVNGTFLDTFTTNPFSLSGLNVMIGATSNETIFFLNTAARNISTPVFNILTDSLFRAEAASIQKFYGASSMGFLEDRKDVTTMMSTDWMFVCPIRRAFQKHPTDANIYNFILEAGWTGSSSSPIGDFCEGKACHGIDALLLFQNASDPQITEVASNFKTYLARFVATSDVNSNAIDLKSLPVWPKVPSASQRSPLLRFPKPVPGEARSTEPVPENDHPRKEACDFWDAKGYFPLDESIPRFSTGLSIAVILVCWILWAIIVALQATIFLVMRPRVKRILKLTKPETLPPGSDGMSTTGSSTTAATGPSLLSRSVSCMIDLIKGAELEVDEDVGAGVGIEIRNLNYKVGDNPEGKQLLHNVTFSCEPGTLTAVLGASGSGKTTVLSLLTRRTPSAEAAQRIYFNGHPLGTLNWKKLQSVLAFVGHHEPPLDGLTPREVLIHAALMGKSRTDEEITTVVTEMLSDLGLVVCADVIIGKENSISAGQRRKLSLALVLLQSPHILVLDEPTSGLDAKSALDVMGMLRFLARKRGKTVICSIHQPRQEIFELFSKVVVMNHGRIAFTGNPQDSLSHFGRMMIKSGGSSGLRSQLSMANLADKMLDLVASNATGESTVDGDDEASEGSSSSSVKISMDGSRTSTESNPPEKRELVVEEHTRGNIITTIMTLNYRWWTTRPLSHKLQMLPVILISIPLSLIERRYGMDLITLGLITKGMFYVLFFLPSIKNIAMSFDHYTDWDMFAADFENGRARPLAFYVHRFIYDNALTFVEGVAACFLTWSLVGGELDAMRTLTIISIFVLHYQTIIGIFTAVYSLPISRPEARSITLMLQAILGFTGGVLIKAEDTAVYGVLSYIQYINPTYWAVAAYARGVLSRTGECLVRNVSEECEATMGDALLENFRIDRVDPNVGMACLLLLFIIAKAYHFGALLWTLNVREISHYFKSKWERIRLKRN